jgi:hypothetical protein
LLRLLDSYLRRHRAALCHGLHDLIVRCPRTEKKGLQVPLQYDDVPGSWGTQSEGWPSTPYSMGKWLLCTKAKIVPYGSFVVVGATGKYPYDYSKAVIRCETVALRDNLERVYEEMFVKCRNLLIREEFAKEQELV